MANCRGGAELNIYLQDHSGSVYQEYTLTVTQQAFFVTHTEI